MCVKKIYSRRNDPGCSEYNYGNYCKGFQCDTNDHYQDDYPCNDYFNTQSYEQQSFQNQVGSYSYCWNYCSCVYLSLYQNSYLEAKSFNWTNEGD